MKVFIAGARSVSALSEPVKIRLNNILSKNYTVIVGDASGVDSAVQKYFSDLSYQNVIVYASEGKARNNIGSWEVYKVDAPARARGFNFYAAKDKAMADDASYGFMIWNGESKGTLTNIINLLNLDKKSIVYLTTNNSFYNIDNMDDLQELLETCGQTAKALFEKVYKTSMSNLYHQASLF